MAVARSISGASGWELGSVGVFGPGGRPEELEGIKLIAERVGMGRNLKRESSKKSMTI